MPARIEAMKVSLRLFAGLHDLVGKKDIVMELPDGARVQDLKARLADEYPIVQPMLRTLVFAIDDECPHSGAPLSEGTVSGEEVECSWHGSRFRLRTGEVLEPPADEPVRTYPVRLSGEDVEVEIQE